MGLNAFASRVATRGIGPAMSLVSHRQDLPARTQGSTLATGLAAVAFVLGAQQFRFSGTDVRVFFLAQHGIPHFATGRTSSPFPRTQTVSVAPDGIEARIRETSKRSFVARASVCFMPFLFTVYAVRPQAKPNDRFCKEQ